MNNLPENDENNLYIEVDDFHNNLNLAELNTKILDHFGPFIDFNTLTIDATEVQFQCFGYDIYDPTDYKQYYHIERIV